MIFTICLDEFLDVTWLSSMCLSIALQRLRAPRVWFEILVLFLSLVVLFAFLFLCFFLALFLSTFFLLGLVVCLLLCCYCRCCILWVDFFLGAFCCSFCFLLKLCVCLFVSGGAAKKKLRTDGSFLSVNRSFR